MNNITTIEHNFEIEAYEMQEKILKKWHKKG